MQALEKIANNTNWISLVLVLLLGMIAVLKTIDSEKLKGYVFAIFNKGFIEDEVEGDTSFFSPFYSLLFLFSALVLALVISLIAAPNKTGLPVSFSTFTVTFSIVFSYFVIKSLLEVALSSLFLIKKQLRFYIVSKFGYLYCISFVLLICFVVCQFGPLNVSGLLCITLLLFFIRFLFHVKNNKNLIFSELFYFILYLCAFEIAPLLTLFKLML